MSRCYWLIAMMLVAAGLFGQQLPESEQRYLEEVYLHLHRHPEVSMQEAQTAAYLMRELDELGISYQYPLGAHNIAGLLENGEGPVVLLRTDMDALPLQEQTGVDYASENQGVMHACGHDLHMTVWLGILRHLHAHRDQWKGSVLFVAQSAEEIGQGAGLMIENGLYERFPQPDYILAYHDHAELPANTIGLRPGWAMANVDMITIKVQGIGGHGAQPHQTIDPVLLAAKIVVNLQSIISRELPPVESGVITIGAIHGGTVGNIIPKEVIMEGTVRSFGDDSRQLLLSAIERTCRGTALSAGVPDSLLPQVVVKKVNTPALYNDPAFTETIRSILTTILDAGQVVEVPMETIGEDFSVYSRVLDGVPSCMLRLGTRSTNGEASTPAGLHSPFFAPDYQEAIPFGVMGMVTVIQQLAKP